MSATSKPYGKNTSGGGESEPDDSVSVVVFALAKGLWLLVWWSILFPMISVPVVATLWVTVRFGPIFGMVLAGLTAAALIGWSQVWPKSFKQWVSTRLRSRWRTCGPIANRGPRYAPCMD